MTKLGSQSVPTAVGHRKPLRSFRLVYTVSMAWTLAPLAAKRVRLRQSWKTSKYSPAPRILNGDAPGQKIPGVSERVQLETEGWKSSEKYPKDLHIFHHISKLTIFQIIILIFSDTCPQAQQRRVFQVQRHLKCVWHDVATISTMNKCAVKFFRHALPNELRKHGCPIGNTERSCNCYNVTHIA